MIYFGSVNSSTLYGLLYFYLLKAAVFDKPDRDACLKNSSRLLFLMFACHKTVNLLEK